MAENKEIVVKLSIQTKDTEAGLESVKSDLKGVEDEIKKINNTPLTLDEQLKEINKQVESGGLSMRELTKKIKDYQTIALQAGRESPIGREAISQAAALQDRVTDLRNEITRLSKDGQAMQGALAVGSTVTAGYGALQGVMALAGQENEALMQSLVKMQAAQSVLMGIESIRASLEKESVLMMTLKNTQTKIATALTAAYATVVGTATGALKIFKLALVATGIGAIIVGIGLLIANFDKVKDSIMAVADFIYNIFKPQIDLVIKALQYLGIVDDDVTLQAKKNAAAKIKSLKAERDAFIKAKQDEIKALDERYNTESASMKHQLDLAKANGKDTVKLERAILEEKKKVTAEKIALLEELVKKEFESNLAIFRIQAQTNDLAKGMLATIEKQIKDSGGQEALINKLIGGNDEINELKDTLKKTENEIEIFDANVNNSKREMRKKQLEEEKNFAEKQRKAEADAQAKFLQDLAALEDEYLNSKLSKEQQEINAVYDKYFAILEAAKKNGEDITLLEEAQAKSVQAITDKYAKEKKDKQILAQNELEAQLFSLREESLQKTLEGFDIERENEVAKLQEKLDSKLITEEQFEQAKLALANYYTEQGNIAIRDADQKALDEKIANINQVGEYASQGFEILSNLSSAFSKDSEKDARKQFNINKAAGIAQATTSTASAIVAQLAVPQDALTGANFVKAGIAGAIGISQIAKIAATKFQPGGGGGGGGDKIAIPSVASGGANGGTSGQVQQNDNLTNIANLLNQQPQPVLVVDSFNKVDREAEKIKAVASI